MKPERGPVGVAPSEELAHLRLLHLADSTLPIGSLAHSFGLETLVSAEILHAGDLPEFLYGYLREAGTREAFTWREPFHLAHAEHHEFCGLRAIQVNACLSAFMPP